MKAISVILAAAATLLSMAPRAATAQTIVPVPEFQSIELKGGGDVTVRHGPVQQVTLLEGDPTISRIEVVERDGKERLLISPCKQRCPRTYRMRVEIVTPRVPAVSVTGGGKIVAEPNFPAQRELAAAVTGGGSIDVRSVPASSVAAAVTGGGSLLVRPRASLMAAVRGGGSIRYWGDPSVTQAVSGGGSVSKAD